MKNAPTENKIYYEILKWEEALLTYEPNAIEMKLDDALQYILKITPDEVMETITLLLDDSLYLAHATIQDHRLHKEFCTQVVQSARVFNTDVKEIGDIHQLSMDQVLFIESKEIGKTLLISYLQGGVVGLGNPLLVLSDLPALLALNIRQVQEIATVYGFDLRDPFEHVLALRIVYAALMPKRSQKYYWVELMDLVRQNRAYPYMYEGDSVHVDKNVIEPLMYELLKLSVLLFLKSGEHTTLQVSLGSLANGQLTKNIAQFAKNFYRKRWILEKADR